MVDLLHSRGRPPPRTRHMLASHFRYAGVSMDELDAGPLETWSEVAIRCEARWPTDGPDDVNSNSFRIWFEAHKSYPLDCVVYHKHHALLRRCGYVLWDAPEHPLDDETLQKRFSEAREKARLERKERRKTLKVQRKSWLSRSVLAQLGARGYWSDVDTRWVHVTWDELNPTAYESDGGAWFKRQKRRKGREREAQERTNGRRNSIS